MKRIFLFLAVLCNLTVYGQANDGTLKRKLSYYLPDISYNAKITSPEDFFGHQVGEWHISHDRLVEYMKLLADQSDRVDFVVYGRTHENRPLVNLHISSPQNLSKKNIIQQQSVELTLAEKAGQLDISKMPLILYQGYSIHGNEPSGVNASVLVAYYLAAGESEEVASTLQNCFILLDPCYNPDGVQRFSTWANSHKGMNLITDPATREYNEMWPGGRTNHYWFDLNRDWLLLIHPESQARVANFHQWKPNVLTDHHEMGSQSTFFFQPGVPSRTNPLTPAENQVLTEKIGNFHAHALDSIGSLYYSKESFDDFYYGKGSTYPDIHGAVGILFEQASSRGHLQESVNGLLSFPFTIRNQVVTSLSTHRACVALKNELLAFKQKFYAERIKEINKEAVQGYVFFDNDLSKSAEFIKNLTAHKIDVYQLQADYKHNSFVYPAKKSFVVPCQQTQGRLVKTIFEKVRSFKDSIFYDVSTWTLPLAFDLKYDEVNKDQSSGIMATATQWLPGNLAAAPCDCRADSYALGVEWQQAHAPAFLYALLAKGIKVRTSTQAITINSGRGPIKLGAGSLIIPLSGQTLSAREVTDFVQLQNKKWNVAVESLMGGAAADGLSAGHPDLNPVNLPKAFTLIGQGVSPYEAGELWHYMDQRLGLPLTLLDKKDLGRANLERYNTLILVDGSYNDVGENNFKKLEEFIKRGGTLICMGKSLEFAKSRSWVKLNPIEAEKPKTDPLPYGMADDLLGSRVVGGAIFDTKADLSHPLCFGLPDEHLALFKQGTEVYKLAENAFATPLRYASDHPALSGYTPRGFEEKLKGSAAALTYGLGNGTVLCFPDNLLFRGYWWGGFRVFANALFFGPLIDRSSLDK